MYVSRNRDDLGDREPERPTSSTASVPASTSPSASASSPLRGQPPGRAPARHPAGRSSPASATIQVVGEPRRVPSSSFVLATNLPVVIPPYFSAAFMALGMSRPVANGPRRPRPQRRPGARLFGPAELAQWCRWRPLRSGPIPGWRRGRRQSARPGQHRLWPRASGSPASSSSPQSRMMPERS